jgi:nucleoid DNA-binding protein
MVRAKIESDVNLMSLAAYVAAEQGTSVDDARATIQVTLDVIGRALANGKKVKLTHFGTFEPGRRRIAKGALGGRVERAMTVRVVKFHLNGKLHDAIRSGRKVASLRKAGKSY